MTHRLLTLCKVVDRRLWGSAHPLRQFPGLSTAALRRLEERRLGVEQLKDMSKEELGNAAARRPR